MARKETNLISVLFLVIGILLLLSLVICIYIVSGESDLVRISAEVVDVSGEATSSGKSEISVIYDVDGQTYKYSYYHKEEVKTGDNVTIYYHEKNPTMVQTFKVNKLIFIWPIIGLTLCILGLFELFKKNDEDEETEFETSVIGVVGNTQQLKIVTDDTKVKIYEPTPEEVIEAPVKSVVKEEDIASVLEVEDSTIIADTKTSNVQNESDHMCANVKLSTNDVLRSDTDPKIVSAVVNDDVQKNVLETQVSDSDSSISKMEDAIVKKVKSDNSEFSLNEEDIKKVIKDVLKEVIQEVKEEKELAKPVVQKKVLPNYYYISGTSLVYEEAGKEQQEIELKTIKSVVRTINSAGNVVKLVVSNDSVKCVLTNMKNIDLEQLASLLNNKMRTIDESFQEEIEYKEY